MKYFFQKECMYKNPKKVFFFKNSICTNFKRIYTKAFLKIKYVQEFSKYIQVLKGYTPRTFFSRKIANIYKF